MGGKCQVRARQTGAWILCLALFTSCTRTVQPTGTRDSKLKAADATLPAGAFFRKPLLSHVALSPSGMQVAALYAKDGTQRVIVRRALGGEVRPVWELAYPGWSIETLGWAGEDHLLVGVNLPHPNAIGVRARASRLMGVPLAGERGAEDRGRGVSEEPTSRGEHD
jgi:hypothetical protein